MMETTKVMEAFERVDPAHYAEFLQLVRTDRPLIWTSPEDSPFQQFSGLFERDADHDIEDVLRDRVFRAKVKPNELGKAVAAMVRDAMSPRVVLSHLDAEDVALLRKSRVSPYHIDDRYLWEGVVRHMEKLLALGLIIVTYSHIEDDFAIDLTPLGQKVIVLTKEPAPSPPPPTEPG